VTFPTEADHTAAVLAFLSSAKARPYVIGDATRTADVTAYSEVGITRRFGGEAVLNGDLGLRLVRITTREVGKLLEGAKVVRSKCAALEGASLTVAGYVTTPIQFETQTAIAEDDGWFSGLTTWTYAV
jgi:hypothetical protein